MSRFLTMTVLCLLLAACGAPTSSFKTPDGRTVQLSDACMDGKGTIHDVGESWDCSDGCNSCWCTRDPEEGNPMILSTLLACYTPEN